MREERMIFMGIKPTSTGLTLQDREGYEDIDMFKREERNREIGPPPKKWSTC